MLKILARSSVISRNITKALPTFRPLEVPKRAILNYLPKMHFSTQPNTTNQQQVPYLNI